MATGRPSVPQTLAFTGRTLDDKEFDAASLAGKPVVLWFWAPWCPECRAAAPDVAKTADRYAGRVSVLGVAGLSDSTASMRDFVATTKTGNLTHLGDRDGAVWRRFGVTSQHTYVLIAADGTVTYTGDLSATELAARVGKLAG
jgi:peroxiredoxin